MTLLRAASLALLTTLVSGPAQAYDFPLTAYHVTLGRVQLPGMDSNRPDTWCAAGIRCISGGKSKEILDICFIPQGIPLPANSSAGTTHTLYRPIAEYPSYIDLLRNEKPLRMSLDSARPQKHAIGTVPGSGEPVGEGGN